MSTLINLPIAKKLAVVFTVLILVSVAVSMTSYMKVNFIETSDRLDTQARQILDETAKIMASMVDQETGLRGYLAAGDENLLEPYRFGQKAYADALARVKELTAGNPAEQARFAEIDRSAQTWHSTVAEKEIALMAKPETREAARTPEALRAGKTSMDRIRSIVADINQTERSVLEKRDADKEDAISTSYTVNILGGVATIVIAIGAGILLSRSIATPIRRMTALMRRLADGDNSVEIQGLDRGDEIGAMAQATEVFKTNAIENGRLRAEQEAQKARAAEEQQQALNRMADNFEARVMDVVKTVASSSTELQSTAQAMSSPATQSTVQATEEISQQVVSVQEETKNTVAIQGIAGVIERIKSIATGISSAVEEQGAATGEIARNVQHRRPRARKRSAAISAASRKVLPRPGPPPAKFSPPPTSSPRTPNACAARCRIFSPPSGPRSSRTARAGTDVRRRAAGN